jgi:hypothetical protein
VLNNSLYRLADYVLIKDQAIEFLPFGEERAPAPAPQAEANLEDWLNHSASLPTLPVLPGLDRKNVYKFRK